MTEVVLEASSEEIAAAYLADDRPARAGRPWITMGMIASLDGSATLAEGSTGLGGPPDRAVFRALRAMSDAIVVGATTVNTEGYRAVTLPDDLQTWRRSRGMPPVPRIAIVSQSLRLELSPSLRDANPIILTCRDSPEDRRDSLAEFAEVIVAGDGEVDLDALMAALAARDVRRVVLEGGPTLNGHMAHLVDEVCMTVAPVFVGGRGPRIVFGGRSRSATLQRVIHSDGHLLLRYLLSD